MKYKSINWIPNIFSGIVAQTKLNPTSVLFHIPTSALRALMRKGHVMIFKPIGLTQAQGAFDLGFLSENP